MRQFKGEDKNALKILMVVLRVLMEALKAVLEEVMGMDLEMVLEGVWEDEETEVDLVGVLEEPLEGVNLREDVVEMVVVN